MKQIRYAVSSVALMMLLICATTVTAYAGNDGNAHDNPFGDSGASISFGGDAKYYDFLMPYNLSIGDIGGYFTSVEFDPGSAYVDFAFRCNSDDQAKKVGRFNREFSMKSFMQNNYSTDKWIDQEIHVDGDTGFEYIEIGGAKFYMATLPKAPLSHSAVADGSFLQWGDATLLWTGIIYDMILKDGTIIHFATCDAIGLYHSNKDINDEDPTRQDKLVYHFAKLNYPQYKNLFHACAPNHTFECCTDGSKPVPAFTDYYNINDSNPVVAIRVWNKTVKGLSEGTQTLTVNSGFSGLSSRGNAISSTSSGSSSSQFVQGNLVELPENLWFRLQEPNIAEERLKNALRENLGQQDLESLTDWNRNHQMQQEENGFIAILRRAVVLVGIFFTLWAILAYLAFWFDHINTIFYVDVLHLVTLGQLHICPPGDKPTFHLGKKAKTRTVNHQQMLGICAIAVLFGVLLISGFFYTIVAKFVNLILGVLS